MTTMRFQSTLAGALWPTLENTAGNDLRTAVLVRSVVLFVVGVALLTVSAKFKVPFYPVPLSLQTLAVLAIGAAYGPRLALVTVAGYLAMGLAGAPVFAGTPPGVAGPAYLLGPTGGFLLGFLPAALIMGVAARRGVDRTIPLMFGAALLADAAIFALGFAWLAFGAQLASGATGIGMGKAWAGGVLPFLLGDVVKCALIAVAFPAVWNLLGRRKG